MVADIKLMTPPSPDLSATQRSSLVAHCLLPSPGFSEMDGIFVSQSEAEVIYISFPHDEGPGLPGLGSFILAQIRSR